MKTLTFDGGIHPIYNKERSCNETIKPLEPPQEVAIPLSQHIGAPAVAIVKKGDGVLVGQIIGEAGGFVSAPVHSSVSGTVKAIEDRPGGMGKPVLSIIIENDEEYKEADFVGIGNNWQHEDINKLKALIKDAGIVGMGGASFPTHVKLSPPDNKPINTVILNGAECEPYLTADHVVMLENSAKIVEGLSIAMKILNAKHGFIGIEINKQNAIDALTKAANADNAAKKTNIKIVPLEVKYPQGAEKQLIDACISKQVPSGGLPMDVGVVVQNVSTALAIWDAIINGRPLFERVVTITGAAINEPANLLIKVGTPISVALDACKANMDKAGKLILGGPMMGFTQHEASAAVTKGTSGILLLEEREIQTSDPLPCIRCGRCLKACPMKLVPADIAAFASKGMTIEAQLADALDCMECGSCAHECPSRLPLVQQIRLAKAAIFADKKKNQ